MTRLPLRGLEQRPLVGDPEEYVRNLVEHGFTVSTIGAMNGLGLAGYPTDFLPPVDGMDPQWIPGVIREAHKQGIAVICWNVFNVQDVREIDDFRIAHRYPEWKMEYIDEPGNVYGPRVGMCVTASPYLREHAKLLREIAGMGVDAMWFDGFYLAGIPHPARPGCVCSYCRDAFFDDTGLELPRSVDWTDPAFRRWVRWRNERLTAAARYVTSEIRDVRPDLPVIFNYNHWPFASKDWETGLPLWKTGDYGVSQHAYTADESFSWVMLGYKAQLSHDLNPDYSDIWRFGRPLFDADSVPDGERIHELQIKQHLLAALTFGTIPWRSTSDYPQVQKRNNAALALREDSLRTESAATVGLVVSQDTHDFWGHAPGANNLIAYRDSILGTWLLLTERHIAFDLVFDNELESVPERCQTLILTQTVCLSDRRASALLDWTEEGGTLIATGAAGACDEWGRARARTLFPSSQAHGSGSIHRLDTDPGAAYARERDADAAAVLTGAIGTDTLPFTVDGPDHLVVRLYTDPDTKGLVLHLLNVSPFYRYANGCGFTGVRGTPAGPEHTLHPESRDSVETASDALESIHDVEMTQTHSFAERPIPELRVTIPAAAGLTARCVVSGASFEIADDGVIVVRDLVDHEALYIGP